MDNEVDPKAQTLVKAIALQEGGGQFLPYDHPSGDEPNAPKGRAGGRYQFTAGTWSNYAQQILGDSNAPMTPENQNKVAYAKVKSWLDRGYTPAQAASMWNAGEGAPDSWKPGTKQAHGDTPDYVKNVQKYAQQLASGNLQQSPNSQPLASANVGYPAPPPPQNIDPNTFQQPDSFTGDVSKGDVGGAVGEAGKGLFNFLFPAVGDIYHDIKGDSTKTGLQQAGDVALTALPFIPGLGEFGESVRGAGLAAKIGAGAGLGYGAGVASNLAQGEDVGQAFAPNVSNLTGAALGGAAPAAIRVGSGLARGLSGIDPQIATELEKMGAQGDPKDVALYNKYIKATQEHATDLTKKPPLTMAADELDKAALKLKNLSSAADQKVGQANRTAADVPMAADKLAPVAQDFNQRLEDSFGVKVAVDDKGEHVLVPTRRGGVPISGADQSRILDIAKRLDDMGNNGNVRMADDLMSTLDKQVYPVRKMDPLTGLFSQTRGQVNKVARDAHPDFAAANDKSSELKRLLGEVKTMAGGQQQRGELLMRRVFSGDKSGDVQDLFNKIKDATGIDLVKHAVLARHAINSFGSKADKTLLEQIMQGAVESKGGGLTGTLLNMGKGAAQKTFANPVKIGEQMVTGTSQPSDLIQQLLTLAAARGGAAIPSQ